MLNQREKNLQNINEVIPANTVTGAITLSRFFLAQARKMVELYGPRKTSLDKNQEALIDSILLTMKNCNNNTVAVSDVMSTFNTLVPDEGRIDSASSFGSLLVKVLKSLEIQYKKARKHKADGGSMAQHVEIPDASEKKLMSIQQTCKL